MPSCRSPDRRRRRGGAARPAGRQAAAADLAASSERILAGLEQGKTDADVPPALAALYRPSVQPYMISWLKYTPAEQLAALRVPVLIVQGTTDIQVGVGQAEALKKARPDAVLAIVPGMNHVLKEVPATASASWHPMAIRPCRCIRNWPVPSRASCAPCRNRLSAFHQRQHLAHVSRRGRVVDHHAEVGPAVDRE
jgi:fermentation-respiration switch protein FrsA (DUF1100 family)